MTTTTYADLLGELLSMATNMTTTYADLLGEYGLTVPDETVADITVPIVTGVQRQGDVGLFPGGNYPAHARTDGYLVPAAGLAVVRGEATGNTHLLDAVGPVFWCPAGTEAGGVALGLLEVPEGSVAYLIHTDEHAALGVGAGTYRVKGKREQAEEIRRVAD